MFILLIVVAWPADVGVVDRLCLHGFGCRTPVDIVGEDGFDRAVGARSDLGGMRGCCLEPFGAVGTGQPHDAKAGAEALFGMRTLLEDDLAECCRRRSDPGCILTDACHGPAGVTAMAGRHMLG